MDRIDSDSITAFEVAAGTSAEINDTVLFHRTRSGDPDAWHLLLQRYQQRLFRIARAIVQDDGEAEDVVQQVYASAFLSKVPFAGQSGLFTWLTRIAINEALASRRRSRNAVVSAFPIDPHECSLEINPEEYVSHQEIGRLLELAIHSLPEPYRCVFVMREIEGLSGPVVAAALGLSDEAVRVRLHRAKAALRGRIGAFTERSECDSAGSAVVPKRCVGLANGEATGD